MGRLYRARSAKQTAKSFRWCSSRQSRCREMKKEPTFRLPDQLRFSYWGFLGVSRFNPNSRKLMIPLVAGGGFVPQSLVDSVQLTDSTMVRNAKKGYKGEFFILFSFSSLVLSCQTRTASRMNKRGRQSQEPPNLRHRLRTKHMPPSPK